MKRRDFLKVLCVGGAVAAAPFALGKHIQLKTEELAELSTSGGLKAGDLLTIDGVKGVEGQVFRVVSVSEAGSATLDPVEAESQAPAGNAFTEDAKSFYEEVIASFDEVIAGFDERTKAWARKS